MTKIKVALDVPDDDCLGCDWLADNDYGGVCTNNLTRPPQSWCYVEGLRELL